MERITDAFVWPLRDPDWLPKVAIIGLILSCIGVLGTIGILVLSATLGGSGTGQ